MGGTVEVKILNVSSREAPPSTRLEYEVRNSGDAPVWLVDDGWLIWNQDGERVELSFKRGKMRAGSQVFGYFPPATVVLNPGDSVSRPVELKWPQPLDRLWNGEELASPAPGRYQVSVRVGYGLTAEAEPARLGEGVEATVFRWQKEASSPAEPLVVPAYRNP
jgi:hypothetical protein